MRLLTDHWFNLGVALAAETQVTGYFYLAFN